MGDALDRVRLAMRIIVTRIDRPFVAGARMVRMQDPVKHGVTQVDIARGHVDPGAQHARAVGKLAGLHAAKQVEILLDRAIAERAVLAGLRQRAAGQSDFLLRLVVDIGKAVTDQALRPVVQPVEIIRGIEQVVAPIVTEPVHIGLYRVDILLLFPGRIGVVEAQVAAAGELLRDAEIERDRLGVADMQVAVRFRREPGHDLLVSACVEIGLDDVANEIASRVRRYRFSRHSLFPSGSENMTRKSPPRTWIAGWIAAFRKRSCSNNRLERDEFRKNCHRALTYYLSMIFSENRYPLFRVMLQSAMTILILTASRSSGPSAKFAKPRQVPPNPAKPALAKRGFSYASYLLYTTARHTHV